MLEDYRLSLAPDRRALLDRYRVLDGARKVVGVGSVGTRAWVVLLAGKDADDPLVLQVKEAGESVVERFWHAAPYAHHGQRVVEGQRLVQSTSDILLGWTGIESPDGTRRDYYVRQLWNGKGSIDLEEIGVGSLEAVGRLCAHALAHAHARTATRALSPPTWKTMMRSRMPSARSLRHMPTRMRPTTRYSLLATRDRHVPAARPTQPTTSTFSASFPF